MCAGQHHQRRGAGSAGWVQPPATLVTAATAIIIAYTGFMQANNTGVDCHLWNAATYTDVHIAPGLGLEYSSVCVPDVTPSSCFVRRCAASRLRSAAAGHQQLKQHVAEQQHAIDTLLSCGSTTRVAVQPYSDNVHEDIYNISGDVIDSSSTSPVSCCNPDDMQQYHLRDEPNDVTQHQKWVVTRNCCSHQNGYPMISALSLSWQKQQPRCKQLPSDQGPRLPGCKHLLLLLPQQSVQPISA